MTPSRRLPRDRTWPQDAPEVTPTPRDTLALPAVQAVGQISSTFPVQYPLHHRATRLRAPPGTPAPRHPGQHCTPCHRTPRFGALPGSAQAGAGEGPDWFGGSQPGPIESGREGRSPRGGGSIRLQPNDRPHGQRVRPGDTVPFTPTYGSTVTHSRMFPGASCTGISPSARVSGASRRASRRAVAAGLRLTLASVRREALEQGRAQPLVPGREDQVPARAHARLVGAVTAGCVSCAAGA